MADDIEFNTGDRDQVVKQLIRHDDSHLGTATERRQLSYWSETEFKTHHPDREYVYWSEFNKASTNDTSTQPLDDNNTNGNIPTNDDEYAHTVSTRSIGTDTADITGKRE